MCQRAAAVTIAIIIAREEFRMQNATMNNRANITVHRTSDSIAFQHALVHLCQRVKIPQARERELQHCAAA